MLQDMQGGQGTPQDMDINIDLEEQQGGQGKGQPDDSPRCDWAVAVADCHHHTGTSPPSPRRPRNLPSSWCSSLRTSGGLPWRPCKPLQRHLTTSNVRTVDALTCIGVYTYHTYSLDVLHLAPPCIQSWPTAPRALT